MGNMWRCEHIFQCVFHIHTLQGANKLHVKWKQPLLLSYIVRVQIIERAERFFFPPSGKWQSHLWTALSSAAWKTELCLWLLSHTSTTGSKVPGLTFTTATSGIALPHRRGRVFYGPQGRRRVGRWAKTEDLVLKERVFLTSSALLHLNASKWISNALRLRLSQSVCGGVENPNQFLDFMQPSGQVITLPFGVFTPPSPNAIWSHWVSITTNPFHSFKINGRGPSLTPEISLAESFSLEHLED